MELATAITKRASWQVRKQGVHVNQSKRWPSRPTWGRFVLSLALPPLFAILLMPGTSLGASRSMRPADPDDSAALLEGVVLSPRHGFAYVMRPGGGLAAVSLASGKVQWRSDRAAKPIALVGDRLIAQAESQGGNALHLVALDARSGAARDSVRIPLPQGVVASVVDTPAGSFRVRAESVASDLVVSWESTGMVAQGYLPAEEEGQAPGGEPTFIAGQAVLDLASPSLTVKAEPTVRLAGSAALTRASLQELDAAVKGVEGRQMLSADGRHVLVSEPVDKAGFTLYRHRWTLYDRSSGARLGSVPAMVSATPFLVVGTTVYSMVPAHALRRDGKFIENPAALHAVNLKSGAEMWKMAVRDTAFRGPFAP